MLMTPRAVEAKREITAKDRSKYLGQLGEFVGPFEAKIGTKNSTSRNPRGRIAAPRMANLENCFFGG